jgi:hypothetical protein
MPSAAYSDFTYAIARGDDRQITIVFSDPDTAEVEDITGWDIFITGKAAIDNDATDAAALFQYEIGSGITITDASAGEATIDISGLDSDALTSDTTVFVDIQAIDTAGKVMTTSTGKITFYREITRRRT